MEQDWRTRMWQQSAALADLVDELPDARFDDDTLCEGWTVRDVMGHMLVGHTTPMPAMLGLVVKYRFNIPKGSFEMSKAKGRALTPDEIRDQWRDVVDQRTRKGISKTIPYRDGFLDHFIHEQDIRRPLGLTKPVGDDVLSAALEATTTVKGPMFAPAKVVAAVRLEATDLDWSHGSGPVVRGPGEALVMAAAGRTIALADLEGAGLGVLSAAS